MESNVKPELNFTSRSEKKEDSYRQRFFKNSYFAENPLDLSGISLGVGSIEFLLSALHEM